MLETNLMTRFVSSEAFKAAERLAITCPATDYPTPDEENSGRFHEHLARAGTAAVGDTSPASGFLQTEEV